MGIEYPQAPEFEAYEMRFGMVVVVVSYATNACVPNRIYDKQGKAITRAIIQHRHHRHLPPPL